jgi:uncharacterized protein (TIGR02231 family)
MGMSLWNRAELVLNCANFGKVVSFFLLIGIRLKSILLEIDEVVIFLPILSLLCFGSVPQDAQQVTSSIDRVTVYSGQAMIERVFSVSATQPGPQSVILGPLPMSVATDSIQTRLVSGNVVLQGLEVRQRTGELDDSARGRLRGKIVGLREDLRGLESEAEAIQAGSRLVASLVGSINSQGVEQFSGMSLDELFAFIDKRTAKLDQRTIVNDRAKADLLLEIQDLEKQLGRQGNAARPYQEVQLSLFFERAGQAQMRLIYLAHGAGWEPVYDVRLDPNLTQVNVGLVSRIRQNTDEDWQDVEVFLSTAQPQVGLDPPALPDRYARVYDPSRPSRSEIRRLRGLGYASSDDASTDEDGLYFDKAGEMTSGVEAEPSFAAAPTVSLQDFGLSQQFQLPDRVTLVAGNDAKQFNLVQVPLEVRPERYVVPSVSDLCYLRAEVTSSADAPMLPGRARIFLGPDFLGEASFPLMRRGDSTMLNLGLDPNVRVEFEQVLDQRDDPSMFSSMLTLNRTFQAKIHLSSAAAGPIALLVEEVIPVSQDDRIRITAKQMHKGYADTDDDKTDRKERGIYRWNKTLRPGAELVMRWGYSAVFHEDLVPRIGN